jgi:hypothetical protein
VTALSQPRRTPGDSGSWACAPGSPEQPDLTCSPHSRTLTVQSEETPGRDIAAPGLPVEPRTSVVYLLSPASQTSSGLRRVSRQGIGGVLCLPPARRRGPYPGDATRAMGSVIAAHAVAPGPRRSQAPGASGQDEPRPGAVPRPWPGRRLTVCLQHGGHSGWRCHDRVHRRCQAQLTGRQPMPSRYSPSPVLPPQMLRAGPEYGCTSARGAIIHPRRSARPVNRAKKRLVTPICKHSPSHEPGISDAP